MVIAQEAKRICVACVGYVQRHQVSGRCLLPGCCDPVGGVGVAGFGELGPVVDHLAGQTVQVIRIAGIALLHDGLWVEYVRDFPGVGGPQREAHSKWRHQGPGGVLVTEPVLEGIHAGAGKGAGLRVGVAGEHEVGPDTGQGCLEGFCLTVNKVQIIGGDLVVVEGDARLVGLEELGNALTGIPPRHQ